MAGAISSIKKQNAVNSTAAKSSPRVILLYDFAVEYLPSLEW